MAVLNQITAFTCTLSSVHVAATHRASCMVQPLSVLVVIQSSGRPRVGQTTVAPEPVFHSKTEILPANHGIQNRDTQVFRPPQA